MPADISLSSSGRNLSEEVGPALYCGKAVSTPPLRADVIDSGMNPATQRPVVLNLEVERQPYFADVTREEAQKLLQSQPVGTYIVRPSASEKTATGEPNRNAFAVTIKQNNGNINAFVHSKVYRFSRGFSAEKEVNAQTKYFTDLTHIFYSYRPYSSLANSK